MASLKSQQMSGLADETGRLFEMILEDYRLYYESVFVRNRSITDVLTAVRDKGNKNRKERYVMMSEELQALYKVSRGYGLGNEFKGFDDQLIDAPEDSTLVSEVQGDPFEVLAMVGREGGMEEDGDNGNDGNLDDDAEEGME
jgi:hypothetical protein